MPQSALGLPTHEPAERSVSPVLSVRRPAAISARTLLIFGSGELVWGELVNREFPKMVLRLRPALIVLGVVACYSCGDVTTRPSRLPTGVWGGNHISLSVTETSTHVELDCAHGDIPAVLTVDRQGQFQVAGTFTREHGGPIRQGEIPDSHPAIYSGQVASTTMTLTIRLSDANETIGEFTLVSGSGGRVFKCL